jgi:hypothetical protein
MYAGCPQAQGAQDAQRCESHEGLVLKTAGSIHQAKTLGLTRCGSGLGRGCDGGHGGRGLAKQCCRSYQRIFFGAKGECFDQATAMSYKLKPCMPQVLRYAGRVF